MPVSLYSYIESLEEWWELVVQVFVVTFKAVYLNMSPSASIRKNVISGDVCALYLYANDSFLHVLQAGTSKTPE